MKRLLAPLLVAGTFAVAAPHADAATNCVTGHTSSVAWTYCANGPGSYRVIAVQGNLIVKKGPCVNARNTSWAYGTNFGFAYRQAC
jgi:hypothetical protein